MKLVALLTDYGLADHYVGVMKAVIKGISPRTEFIDLTHEITPFDIREGAFLLLQASKHLPKGCAVLAVVDPGVNTGRLAIAVRTRDRVYVGPDNGILYPAASREGIISIYDIGRGRQVLSPTGTFAGRDIFAPTVAEVTEGRPLGQLGRRVPAMKVLELPAATFTDSAVTGTVMHVDRFGNAVTSIGGEGFQAWRRGESRFTLRLGDRAFRVDLAESYQEIKGVGLVVGSSGTVEVSARERAPAIDLKVGGPVVVEFLQKSAR